MMEGGSIGKDLTQIAVLLVGVAMVALLVGHASGTAALIGAGTSGFNQLLQTVTLQNGIGGMGGGMSSFGGGLQMPQIGFGSGGMIP
jgi:hypothetical protein